MSGIARTVRAPGLRGAPRPGAARPLRVGIVMPGWADTGLPAVVDLVRGLAARFDVRVVALRHPPMSSPFLADGFEVHPLGIGNAGGLGARSRVLGRGVATLVRLHRVRRFDVLHALWADEPGAVAVVAGRILGLPVVVSVLGGELVALPEVGYGTALGAGGRLATAGSLAAADAVTVGSSVLERLVRSRVRADATDLIPLGVDLDAFAPRPPVRIDAPIVLHVGSLEPVKDQVTLLRAFARVAHVRPDARLEICGQGSLEPRLRRLARELDISSRVDWLGPLPRSALRERYAQAAVLVVSSRWEAQGMAAVEAAACGLPVVGTRVGCLPDLGAGARTVAPGDVVALAATLGTVLDDPELRRSMGRAARDAATARFSATTTLDAFGDLYRDVLIRGRPVRRAGRA